VIGGSDKYMAVCRSCYNLPAGANTTDLTPTRNIPSRSGGGGRQLIFPENEQ